MTGNEAMRTIFVRTRPALHEAEAEAENFGLEATLTSIAYNKMNIYRTHIVRVRYSGRQRTVACIIRPIL